MNFSAQPPVEGGPKPKLDLTLEIVADLRVLGSDARLIVARGRESFLSPAGRLDRHAADAIILKVQELCSRLPDAFQDAHPDVPWQAIRGVRNRIGHNYRSTDYGVIWNTVAVSIPELVHTLSK